MNDALLKAYRQSREVGAITPVFLSLLDQLAREKFVRRYGALKDNDSDFVNQMHSWAMNMVLKSWNTLDLEKSTNAYAFFSTIIIGAFIGYLSKMRKKRTLEQSACV